MITRCNSESLSVYVHFPFCKRKCTYCDFASYEGMEHRIPTYMEALKKEIIEKSAEFEKRKIYTVYFGGGTPTYPDSGWIQKIMNLLKESFDCSFCEESTLEANPGTVTPESLKKYKEAGFNRLSIGLQSANDRELEKAGRIHRYRDFLESYQYARNAGFANINVDLIFGFPWQSYQDWKNSVDTLVSLNPEHISCYDLILEEGTPLFNQIQKGEYVMISDFFLYVFRIRACQINLVDHRDHFQIVINARYTLANVWASIPWDASTTSRAPSQAARLRDTSYVKSTCPGVSMRFNIYSSPSV
jgi:putative oxygen-independent coproporphyrinogen III oxidase